MTFAFWVEAISMLGVLFSSFYIFERAMNYPTPFRKKALSVLWCMLWAVLYAAGPLFIPLPLLRPLICVTSIVFVLLLAKLKPDTVISAYLLSFGISYSLYYIASFTVSFIAAPLVSSEYVPGTPIDINQPVYLLIYTIIFTIQLSLAVLLFRIRRFRKGFQFLFKRYAIIIALVSTGTILVFVTWVGIITKSENAYTAYLYFVDVLIIGVGIYIWIKRGIKTFQKRLAKEHNDELHKQELAQLNRELQQYKDMQETVRAANHSMRHRQSAVERRVVGVLEKAKGLGLSDEFSEELSVAITDIRNLSKEYQKKVDRVKVDKNLPSTNIQMIDDLFGLFSARFANSEIDFKLKVKGSIIYMVDNIVAQSKLETMIGDHLQDAMIAVNAASDNTIRSVLAVIGEAGDHYEFSIYDSGIPFEVDTLVRLGTERVTTHTNEGGSGIGFMTTFETMQECGASLIINEYTPGGAFSKSVTIRFDDKNQYIIETYRSGDFPEIDRYSVVGRK